MDLDNLMKGCLVCTATAPVNIAVVKYWGKRDTQLILPVNSSLSGTIDMESMRSKTTAVASMEFKEDKMWLNGAEEDMSKSKRLSNVLRAIRERAQTVTDKDGKVLVKAEDWPKYRVQIVSENNFPTAAGLASSASGFACLTRCLASLYNVQEKVPGELTAIARQGSGSACRSLHGGFVAWDMGVEADGSDSLARQVVDEKHWPEMRVLILVVNKGRKETSSTSGMQLTVETSPLIKYRADVVVPQRMKAMEEAIQKRDFEAFADLTMADSNQFHAVCLDTLPPIFYMNDTSKRIIHMVHAMNKAAGRKIAAYTFDAGPNAVIYLLEKDMNRVLETFLHYFKPQSASVADFVTDTTKISNADDFKDVSGDAEDSIDADLRKQRFIDVLGPVDSTLNVARIIVSKLGEGAKTIEQRNTF
eukprot:TRINITY_DN66613_c7_g5_i1.p1 TRINITY_DN66613_c7_g5~~TRINITY_DN66613_c7_g5_i1.p1  ORF type:complete len:418 (-),score=240.00 TRINITY_DN66613_c7_g5_i1:79-1332(-)